MDVQHVLPRQCKVEHRKRRVDIGNKTKKHSIMDHHHKVQIRLSKRSPGMPGRSKTKKKAHNGLKDKYQKQRCRRKPLIDQQHCHQNTRIQTYTHTTNATDDEQKHGDMQKLPHTRNILNEEAMTMLRCTNKQHDRIAMKTPNNVINTNIEHHRKMCSMK